MRDVAVKLDSLYRGRFITFDASCPQTEAIGVIGQRIVALGDDARELPARAVHDLSGSTCFPGFHDAHVHTVSFGLSLSVLDLSTPPIESMDALYAAVAAYAASLPADGLVVGRGYDQNKLGGGHPEARRLDEAAGGRPVWLQHTSGHMCVVNTEAMRRIGGDLDAAIDGGRVVRGPDGAPTGLLEERAQALAQRLALPRSVESIQRAIAAAHTVYATEGVTSVCDAGVAGGWIGESPAEVDAYQRAREAGSLRARTTLMVAADVLHPLARHRQDLSTMGIDAGIRSGLGDEWLRIGAMKVFSDGSLIGRTCWMHDGFDDDPSNHGYPQQDPELLRSTIVEAHLAGWQVATHAIGDAAITFVLDAYEEALRRRPRPDHRHRIEHCGVTSAHNLERIAGLGVIPVPQGRFVGELGDGMARAVGASRLGDTYRLASFLSAGITLPGSSDRPVVDGNPLRGIVDMVVRDTESGAPFGHDERLSVGEALRCYTTGSAFATRSDHERGSLSVGMLADIVALGDDPRQQEDPRAIAAIPVVATIVGGDLVYAR